MIGDLLVFVSLVVIVLVAVWLYIAGTRSEDAQGEDPRDRIGGP